MHQFMNSLSDQKKATIANNHLISIFTFIIKKQRIEEDEEEMYQFLKIIKSIGEHHHRDQHFNESMNQLLFHYKDKIK